MTPIVYLGKDYDQLVPQKGVLEWAARYYVQGKPRFWVVLPEYRLKVTEDCLRDLETDLSDYASYVFQTEQIFDSNVRTTLGEYHSHHGGLYLFNTQDYLSRLSGTALGIGCYTRPEVCTARYTQVPIYVSYTPEEIMSGSRLHRVRLKRDMLFKEADLTVVNRTSEDTSIAAHHDSLFSMVRRDVCVVDADFLPASAEALQELRFVPDVSNNTYSHVWFCRNPVNGLVYGHGAPKVFPRVAQLMRRPSTLHTDFFLSVGTGVVVHPKVLGTHVFNWSAKSTFYAAAKECAKLALAAPTDPASATRLQIWNSRNDAEMKEDHAELCLAGAALGTAAPMKVLSDRSYLSKEFLNLNPGAAYG